LIVEGGFTNQGVGPTSSIILILKIFFKIHSTGGCAVVKLVILATWEAEMGRIMVEGPPSPKIFKTPFQQMAGYDGI
jgi:hypothetical protein